MCNEISLCAFPAEDMPGYYNVWRYDSPATMRILFCYKADSREDAEEAALQKIHNQTIACNKGGDDE